MGKRKAAEIRPIIGDFIRPQILWDDEAEKRMFASEASFRWFMRQHRQELIAANAICKHAGEFLIHPGRFEKVAEAEAIAAVRRSTAGHEVAG